VQVVVNSGHLQLLHQKHRCVNVWDELLSPHVSWQPRRSSCWTIAKTTYHCWHVCNTSL